MLWTLFAFPPNSYVETQTPDVTIVGDGVIKEVTEVNVGL